MKKLWDIENLAKSRKTQKTENATWRKKGARPGPPRGPLLLITGAFITGGVGASGNGFPLFLTTQSSRGGPLGAPFRAPPGAPPGPQKSRNRKNRKKYNF